MKEDDDSRDTKQPDDSGSDDTDVEYYTASYGGTTKKGPVTSMMGKRQVTSPRHQSKKSKSFTCSVCYDDFNASQEFLQHLSQGDCQPEDSSVFECDICRVCLSDVDEYRKHRLAHVDVNNVSCMACGSGFPSKRALDRHMFLDANILNGLFKSGKVTTMPDMLCGTVVKNLAKSADIPTALPSNEEDDDDEEEMSDDKGDDTDDYDAGRLKGGKNRDYDDSIDNFDENDEDGGQEEDDEDNNDDEEDEEEEDCDESNLPSDIEHDLGEAESRDVDEEEEGGDNAEEEDEEGEDDSGTITHPFLSSAFTDLPMTSDTDNMDREDSVTSQSMNSTEDTLDATASSSRRKSKRPKQIQRITPASKKSKFAEASESDDTRLTSQSANGEQPEDICPMCGEQVPEDQTMSSHIAEHEKLFPFFCTLCDANSTKGHLLKVHVVTCHSVGESLSCEVCGMSFKLRETLAAHKKNCKQAPECVVCGKTFNCARQLEKHFYSHPVKERCKVEYFPCEECGEVFSRPKKLRAHQKLHNVASQFSCEICGSVFAKKKVMEKHKQAHFRDQDCRCHICGAQLLTLSGLLAHLRGHRNNQNLEVTQQFMQAGFGHDDDDLAHAAQAVKMRIKQEPDDSRDGEHDDGEDDDDEQPRKRKREEEDGGGGYDENEELSGDMMLSSEKYLELIDPSAGGSSSSTRKGKKILQRQRPHKCPFCKSSFYKIDRFQAHIRKEHETQAMFDECELCHVKIYGKEYMRIHRRTHTSSPVKYSCDQCSKVFVRKFALETHRKVHTFRKFLKCEICNEGFRFVSELDRHIRRAHPIDRSQCTFTCNICSATFTTLQYLETHCTHSHRPEQGQPYQCAICPQDQPSCFVNLTELKRHVYLVHGRKKTHTDDEDVVDSPKKNAGPMNVKQEPLDNSYSGVSQDDPLFGQVQDMIRNFVSTLPCQENTDITIKPKVEDPDDQVEAYNKATRQRMSQASMPRKFECETCNKLFCTKSDLRTHTRTHTGETPYKCDYCERAFKQRGHKKLHIQVAHTNDMPYTCELCGQSYPTRYRYQVHVKRHSGIKEHVCQYCPNKAYYTVGKLNEHKRKHHMEEFLLEQAQKEAA